MHHSDVAGTESGESREPCRDVQFAMNNLCSPTMKPPAHVPSTKSLADQHTRYHVKKQAPMPPRDDSRKRRLDFDDVATKSGRTTGPYAKSLKQNDSFRKDMYLVFVKNALKERVRVSTTLLFNTCVADYRRNARTTLGKSSAVSRTRWPVQPR